MAQSQQEGGAPQLPGGKVKPPQKGREPAGRPKGKEEGRRVDAVKGGGVPPHLPGGSRPHILSQKEQKPQGHYHQGKEAALPQVPQKGAEEPGKGAAFPPADTEGAGLVKGGGGGHQGHQRQAEEEPEDADAHNIHRPAEGAEKEVVGTEKAVHFSSWERAASSAMRTKSRWSWRMEAGTSGVMGPETVLATASALSSPQATSTTRRAIMMPPMPMV